MVVIRYYDQKVVSSQINIIFEFLLPLFPRHYSPKFAWRPYFVFCPAILSHHQPPPPRFSVGPSLHCTHLPLHHLHQLRHHQLYLLYTPSLSFIVQYLGYHFSSTSFSRPDKQVRKTFLPSMYSIPVKHIYSSDSFR